MKKLFILLVLAILLVTPLISAADWDNKLYYSGNDLKVTITNSFLLLFPTSEIGTAELKSHSSVDEIVKYGAGNQVTMFYDFSDFRELYLNGLGKVYFTDMRTGELIDRDYSFVYWGEKERDVYGQGECSLSLNGTQICVGKETYNAWLPYNSKDIPKGNIRIGLMTYVEVKDKVDGVWTITGKKVSRHAEWSAELEVGLVAYYKLDEASDTTFIDAHGNNDMSNDGADNVTGKINSAYDFELSNGDSAWTKEGITYLDDVNSVSVSVWVKFETCGDAIVNADNINDTQDYFALRDPGTNCAINWYVPAWDNVQTDVLGTGVWWHIVGTHDGDANNLTVYVNKEIQDTKIFAETLGSNPPNVSLSTFRGDLGKFDGVIDEVGIWNRSLTAAEVTQLWNDGDGLPYGIIPNITIELISPEDDAIFTTYAINFSANISDPAVIGIKNVSLVINESIFETNTSGFEGFYNFSNTVPDGDHNWTIIAYDDTDAFYEGDKWDFIVDTIDPEITSNSSVTFDFQEINTNLTIYFNITETNPHTCLYDYDGTNISIGCGNTSINVNTTTFTNRNIIFYVNDTAGQEAILNVNWNYRLFLVIETFNVEITEGLDTIFSANFQTNGSDITLAILYYNLTVNTGTIMNHGGNNFTVIKTIVAPSVSVDKNVSFYWNITQGNLNPITLDTKNQTILNLGIDDCSVFTNLIFNYTIVDEENQSFIYNTTLELDLNIFSLDGSRSITNYSKSYGSTNPATVCLNLELTNHTIFSLNSIVRYEATNHTNEYYNMQNFTLKNSTVPQVITLYSLLSKDSTEFQITFKDSNFAVVENALIQIDRQYISEGVFKTVEIPKTDSNGQTVGHIVEKEVIYNFIVIKEGVILGTFNNVVAFCQDAFVGNCFIFLNAIKAGVVVFDYDEEIGLAFSFSYNESSRLLQFPFTTLDGGVKNVSLLAIKMDQLGNTTACSQSLVTSSGIISCPVDPSIGNATLIVEIFVDGDLRITNYISTGTPFDLGDVGYFLMFFLVLSLALMMTQSKIAVILGVVLGFISSTLLSFVKGGILAIGSSVTWLIIMAIILIWKLNSQAQT